MRHYNFEVETTDASALAASEPLIRQSTVLAGQARFRPDQLLGQATAPYPHTDLTTVADEARVTGPLAKLGRPALLANHVGTATGLARGLGVTDDFSDERLASLVRSGVLDWTGMWMSPDHRAQPLAVCDKSTVDLSKCHIVGFAVDPKTGMPDYTRVILYLSPDGSALNPTSASGKISYLADAVRSRVPECLSGCVPRREFAWEDPIGQIQYAYTASPAHRCCYFDDLAADEALVFERFVGSRTLR